MNEIKIEAAEDEEPVGRGQKRKRKGKDKPSQPVKSYTTRERAKAEAEVVAEVSASCFHVDMSYSSFGISSQSTTLWTFAVSFPCS